MPAMPTPPAVSQLHLICASPCPTSNRAANNRAEHTFFYQSQLRTLQEKRVNEAIHQGLVRERRIGVPDRLTATTTTTTTAVILNSSSGLLD